MWSVIRRYASRRIEYSHPQEIRSSCREVLIIPGALPETRVITQIQSKQGLSNAGKGLQLRSKQRRINRIREVRGRT
jgi:hypothetical protein